MKKLFLAGALLAAASAVSAMADSIYQREKDRVV
jgi:Spy/CpxP family protein refolding chaperone